MRTRQLIPASLTSILCEHISALSSSVAVVEASLYIFKNFKVIEFPAKWEILSAFRYLTARNILAAYIHRQLVGGFATEAMSDRKARKWVRKFKDKRTNVNDEERSRRPSVITDDLIQAVETKIREKRRFTISIFRWNFAMYLGQWCTKL
ncbi:HTH_48 domain-containing protein [Trichonephila clavipes]|nr:HTH_48 domain-containing protein [Trichonephila clavipes]